MAGRPTVCTIEALTKFLDSQCSNSKYSLACARAGISQMSFWRARLASSQNDPAYVMTYLGVEAQFASHLRLARDIYMSSVENAALERAERGTRELIFQHGQPTWKLDHRYEGWSDDDLTTLGLSNEDRYEHDSITGHRIQNSILHPAPVELVKTVLAAYSKRYQAQSHVDINSTVSLGVSVIGDAKPKAIAVPPMVELVGRPTEVAGVFEEIEQVEQQQQQQQQQQPVEQPAPPPPPDGIDRSPDNKMRAALEMQQEIRDRRVAAERAAGKLPPQAAPLPPEMKPDLDRDLPDGSGDQAAKAAPVTMDTTAAEIHEVKRLLHLNLPLTALRRQVANALKRGDEAGARTLLGYRPPADGERLGAGNAPAGGASLAGGRPGSYVKMV